jgi:hypothetical protein
MFEAGQKVKERGWNPVSRTRTYREVTVVSTTKALFSEEIIAVTVEFEGHRYNTSPTKLEA